MRNAPKKRVNTGFYFAAAAVIAACALLISDPKSALEGGVKGFDIFVRIVFPSLLPFFIVTELMIGLGVVHFIGTLLEPLMRPLFNAPGVGAFAFSMGLAAGYPMDAVITSKLRRSGACSQVEGERILAFSNTADPLFILGALGVGMFHNPTTGWILAAGHYGSVIVLGLLFRFHGRSVEKRKGEPHTARPGRAVAAVPPQGRMLRRALQNMHRAHKEDGRHFGRLLADSVNESMHTLIKICGFIMLFSAVVSLFQATGLLALMAMPIRGILQVFGGDLSLAPGIVAGLLELDIGSAMVAAGPAPLPQALAAVGGIIAWSGLSVHGQVASIIADTDMRIGVYMLSRLLHGVLGALFSYIAAAIWPVSLNTAPSAAAALATFPEGTLGVNALMFVAAVAIWLMVRIRSNQPAD